MREGELNREQENFSEPVEITTQEDLVEFFLVFRRNNGMSFPDEQQERRMLAHQVRNILQKQATDPASDIHFFGIKKDGHIVATGEAAVKEEGGEKRGYLALATVDEPYRGQGLARTLTDKRIQFLKEKGCAAVDTNVYCSNPPALATKLNDGFRIVSVTYDPVENFGSFSLTKALNGPSQEAVKADWQEISLKDIPAIQEALQHGWQGVDIKNTGDKDDMDTNHWTLIFEKSKE